MEASFYFLMDSWSGGSQVEEGGKEGRREGGREP